MIPLEQRISCVKRELTLRRRCYPGWVASGRIKQHMADMEIATMEAVLETLEELRRAQQVEMAV